MSETFFFGPLETSLLSLTGLLLFFLLHFTFLFNLY